MIGYEHIDVNGFLWRKHQGVLLPLSMPHVQPDMDEERAALLLKGSGCFLVRWDEKFDELDEGEWWHVIKDSHEDIMALGQSARSMIRKADKVFDVKLCSKEAIQEEGYAVYQAAYRRYDTFEPMYSASEFSEQVEGLVSGTEFFGVYRRRNGELVAFSENVIRDDACFYVSIWLEPEAMKEFSGYLLIHEMNKYYLNVMKLRYVTDGARSISHQTNIHEFLQQRFAFRKAYASLKVVYVPWLRTSVDLLYPFRKFIRRLPGHAFHKLSVLLEQERIRRSCLVK